MFLVENERTKLTASWLNTLATAIIAAGAFAPAIAILVGVSPMPIESARVIVLAIACVVVGNSIHLGARYLLGSLRE
ncbi:MAG: hypothetical protein E6G97_22695 [Alphaproteobacteria bacterium]|nr:MAG: hypothetical protein E6G97_22695 [Alphaproteobacteria bacterium]